MKTREIVCKYYQCEHSCALGKDAEFRGVCQHCGKYEAKEGRLPARVNKRRRELEKIGNREFKENR